MKKITLLSLVLLFSFRGIAQNNDSGNYKNWIVDYTQARSSFAGVKLDKLELNSKYTIAHMSFQNRHFVTQHIEACNTFHIRSNGKKIATFIKAENIPTRNIDQIGFSCADEKTSMKIPPGMFVRFRIYFTRIPEYLNVIDIIEYDGFRECEFDIFNLNISRKEPLLSSNYSTATAKPKSVLPKKSLVQPNTKIVKLNSKKSPSKKSKKPQPSNSDEPLITSKSVVEPKEKLTEPLIPAVKLPEQREVSVRKDYFLKIRMIQIEVWDNDQEDGDKASLMLNKRWVLKGVTVTKSKKKIEIPLQMGENILTFHADNLGTAPPNTAAIKFFDGLEEQTIVLNSDMDKSEAIRLIRN